MPARPAGCADRRRRRLARIRAAKRALSRRHIQVRTRRQDRSGHYGSNPSFATSRSRLRLPCRRSARAAAYGAREPLWQCVRQRRRRRSSGRSPTRSRDATWPADETDRANWAAGHLRSNSLKAGPLGRDREVSVAEPLIGDQIQDPRESRTPTWLLGSAPFCGVVTSSLFLWGRWISQIPVQARIRPARAPAGCLRRGCDSGVRGYAGNFHKLSTRRR